MTFPLTAETTLELWYPEMLLFRLSLRNILQPANKLGAFLHARSSSESSREAFLLEKLTMTYFLCYATKLLDTHAETQWVSKQKRSASATRRFFFARAQTKKAVLNGLFNLVEFDFCGAFYLLRTLSGKNSGAKSTVWLILYRTRSFLLK